MKDSMIQQGIKVSIISIIANIFLCILKTICGLLGKSNAMISDGIHSLADVLSTVVVMIGFRLSRRKEDEKHPYGHERIECVAAFLLSILLFITGIGIGLLGFKTIFFHNHSNLGHPTFIALFAAFISIFIKEIMFWYTKMIAKKIKSDSLMADAWHNRTDSLSSIGSLIGIVGAMLGLKVLDPIASIVIAIFIIKVGYHIFIDSINKMIDVSCNQDIIEDMKRFILKMDAVENIDLIKTRLFGNRIYIDLEIGVNKDLSLEDANQIANMIHDGIENNWTDVKHCMVKVNPRSKSE